MLPGLFGAREQSVLMERLKGAMMEGTNGVKNGEDWELKDRDQSLGCKLRGCSISSGELK